MKGDLDRPSRRGTKQESEIIVEYARRINEKIKELEENKNNTKRY